MAETSSSSSLEYSSSSSSKDSSSSSTQSSSSFSSKSSSSTSSLSTSSSSSKDSSTSSSSSLWELGGERVVPFVWSGIKSHEVKSFAYYGNKCFAGMSGDGQVLRSVNRFHWEKFFETEDYSAQALYIYQDCLFVGSAPKGKVFRIKLSDGTTENIETLYSPSVKFFEVGSKLYLATARNVYEYEQITKRFFSVYEAYGNITDVYSDGDIAMMSMDNENIVSFDGKEWKLVDMGKDNVASFRAISKDPFSKINYEFVNRGNVAGKTLTVEDYITVMPYNKEAGISTITKWNKTLVAGGLNYGRIFGIQDGKTSMLFDTDEDRVYSVLPIDSKTLLVSMGNVLYLGYFGQLSNPKPATVVVPVTPGTTPIQNPSETKNVKIKVPNGKESYKVGDTVAITWESVKGINDVVKLEVHKNGEFYYLINGRTGNTGTYPWIIPSSFLPGNEYKMYIEWLSATAVAKEEDKDYSDATFEVKAIESSTSKPKATYLDQTDRWYFVRLMDFEDEHIVSMSKDDYYYQIIFGTSKGRILSTDEAKINAYATGNRSVYGSVKNSLGQMSNISQTNVMYSLYNRLAEISSGKSIEKWKFSRMAAINSNEKIIGVFISPILNVKNDFGLWKTLVWEEVKTESTNIRIFLKAAKSVKELYAKDWEFGFESTTAEIGLITRELNNVNLDGSYLQIKVEMETAEEASSLSRIMVEYSTKNASYFFTTNFQMETGEKSTRGFVTANITQPVNTEIFFGVTDQNSADWNDYSVIDRDTFFNMENFSNLKIGIKFVSYDTSLPVVSEFSLIRNKE